MGTAWDLFLKPPLFHCLWWLNLCKEVSVADEPSWYSVLGGLTHQTPLPGLHTTWTTRESCKDSSLPNELPGQLFSCVLSWNNKNTPSFCQPSRSVWDGNIRLRSTCSAVPIFHNHKSSSAKPSFFTETPPSIRSVPKASHSLHPVPFLLCPPPPPRPLHLQTLHIFVCVCVCTRTCFSVTRLLVFVQLGILYISVLRIHREADVVLSWIEAKDNVWKTETGVQWHWTWSAT